MALFLSEVLVSSAKADLTLQDKCKNTALHLACSKVRIIFQLEAFVIYCCSCSHHHSLLESGRSRTALAMYHMDCSKKELSGVLLSVRDVLHFAITLYIPFIVLVSF